MQPFLRREPYSNTYPVSFPRHALEAEKPTHLIKPMYSPRGISNIEFDTYVTFIEQILRSLLPEDLIIALSTSKDPQTIQKGITSLYETLPLLSWNNPELAPCTLCVSLICHSQSTSGVGRYMCDILSRWLIPGKCLNISSVRSLKFTFITSPDQDLFFHQILLDIDNDQHLSIIKSNQANIEKEIRLSILAVRHARNVVSTKNLSSDQKKAIIEENIASVLALSAKNLDHNVFDQMHNFMLHLSAEDKIQQIQEQIAPYLEQRPKIFDRDIFQEIKHSMLTFGDSFTALRDLRYVSRLISYRYLFRKTLMRKILSSPEERHLSLKILKTRLRGKDSRAVLGIVGGMNVLRENELFEEKHILEAVNHCLHGIFKVKDSFSLDRRSHDPIRIFYLEIEKKERETFSLEELRELKKSLPHALRESVESVLHPVLMPRNEEEIMRNIVLLSQQLKYINDLPQVVISFNAQTEQSLQFTVILLRVLRDNTLPIQEIFAKESTDLKIQEIEIKRVGLLRKRYPKEANVFKVSLNKNKFLRKDFTIDLFKARQAVSFELNEIFQGIRDFNGGILSKQHEVFQELRTLTKSSSHKDFLLENFFYSLTPPLRQTLIPPSFLKILFTLMQEALESDYKEECFFLKAQFEADQVLVMAASPYSSLKEKLLWLITKFKIPFSDLSCTYVNAQGIHCFGYIYHNRDQNIRNLFYSTFFTSLKEWQSRIKLTDRQ